MQVTSERKFDVTDNEKDGMVKDAKIAPFSATWIDKKRQNQHQSYI